MIVVCCYVPGMLKAETEVAIRQSGEPFAFFSLDGDNPFSYGRTLAKMWAQCLDSGDDLCVVEQDVVIRPDVVEAFRDCPCEYGGFPYSWGTDVGVAMGCTRFRSSFIARYPAAMQQAVGKNVTWRQFDVVFQRHILVREYGEQPHLCGPEVVHLNEAKRRLPDANPVPLETLPAW